MKELVFSILERNGFHVVAEKRFRFKRRDVEIIYERCIDADFFEGLSAFLMSGDSVAIIVEDGTENVIKNLNSVVGHTDPKLAKPGTVRSFGENIRYNLMHSTMDMNSFLKEARHLFSPEELDKIGFG